jgi:hypothetical protein
MSRFISSPAGQKIIRQLEGTLASTTVWLLFAILFTIKKYESGELCSSRQLHTAKII